MAQQPTRRVWKIVLETFLKSFRIRQIRGNFVGEDYFGNKYYEIPKDASRGKSKTSRWFEPAGDKERFEQEITAEWEAWLRGRRKEPPKNDEVMKNLAIMQMKKKNAAELDKKYGKAPEPDLLPKQQKGLSSFPSYKEYELNPGAKSNDK